MNLMEQLQRALGTAYRIERELGGGGMSHVYLAEEVALGRRVVVKVLPPEMAASVSVDRFRREIQLAAQLQHPGIVPLHAAGADGELLWYTMPFVEGESLRTRLARGPLPVDEAVRLWRDLLEALEYAHGRGIVHRDIKPENIMLTGRRAVTLDFGVAKAVSASTSGGTGSATGVGFVVGTPAYMAPEQAAGDGNVDARADLYAAGLVLYEMLAGRGPFEARTPAEWMAAHLTKSPERVRTIRTDVPLAVEQLLVACLEKAPHARPSGAAALLAQLENPPVSAVRHVPLTSAKSDGRRKALLATAASVLLILVVLGYSPIRQSGKTQGERVTDTVPTDSAKLTVAIMPLAREDTDSILGRVMMSAMAAGINDEKISFLRDEQLNSLAEDAGLDTLPLSSPEFIPVVKDAGIHLLLEPTLARVDDARLISIEVRRLVDNAIQFRIEKTATSVADLPAVASTVAAEVRAHLLDLFGKVPRPDVTGRTFGTTKEAARFLYESRQAGARADYYRGAEFARQAIQLDSTFVNAWQSLATALENVGTDPQGRFEAYEVVNRLTDSIRSPTQRAIMRGRYLAVVKNDGTGCLDTLEQALRRRIDDRNEQSLLLTKAVCLRHNKRPDLALSVLQPLTDRRAREPSPALSQQLMRLYLDLGRSRDGDSLLRRMDATVGATHPATSGMRDRYFAGTRNADSMVAWGAHVLVDKSASVIAALRSRRSGFALAGRLDSATSSTSRIQAEMRADDQIAEAISSAILAARWQAAFVGNATKAKSDLDAALKAMNWSTRPVLNKSYGQLVQFYAEIGEVGLAQRLLAQWQRELPAWARDLQAADTRRARGYIELALARPRQALADFEAGLTPACNTCDVFRFARAYDAMQNADSAIFWYERYLNTYHFQNREDNIVETPRAYRRLGELYEAKGDTKRAIQRYSDFVELWKNADPALQPLVKDVRERIARLQKKTG